MGGFWCRWLGWRVRLLAVERDALVVLREQALQERDKAWVEREKALLMVDEAQLEAEDLGERLERLRRDVPGVLQAEARTREARARFEDFFHALRVVLDPGGEKRLLPLELVELVRRLVAEREVRERELAALRAKCGYSWRAGECSVEEVERAD